MTRRSCAEGRPDQCATDATSSELSTQKLARTADPATSHEAARRSEGNRSRLAPQILEYFEAVGPVGVTDDELHAAFPSVNPSTVRSSRKRLQLQGVVEDSGEKRHTRSNSPAIVWRVVK